VCTFSKEVKLVPVVDDVFPVDELLIGLFLPCGARVRELQWLQTAPYNSPGFPYVQFCAVNYDMTWQELLDTYQIPYTTRELHFRAHRSESTW